MFRQGAKVQSIRGGGVGGAPPPRTGFATGRYPTTSHSATQISSFAPHDLNAVSLRTSNTSISRAFLRARDRAGSLARSQAELHPCDLHRELRGIRVCDTLRGAAWETRGVVTETEGSMLRLAPLLAALALLLTACGGGGGAAGADPASAVPRDALFYMEATVSPEGELRADALDAAGKILRTSDPEAKLRELLAEVDDFDYDRDVKPWLGDRAGMWVSARLDENDEPGVALVVAVTDPEAAEESLAAAYKRSRDTRGDPLARRGRLQGRRRRRRACGGGRLRAVRRRTGVQAHDRHARRRRAGRPRAVPDRHRGPRGRAAGPLLRRYTAPAGARDRVRSPAGAGAQRIDPVRPAAAGRGRVPGRRLAAGARRAGRAPARRRRAARPAGRRRWLAAAGGAAGRRVGRAGDAARGRDDPRDFEAASRAPSGAPRSSASWASTSSATS